MKRNADIGFILLPGGGMGSWIWEYLTPLLEYPSLCVEERADYERHPDIRKITINDCADHIAECAETAGFEEIILVGHSGSGCIAEITANKLNGRVRDLVFIAANIPPQGKRTVDVFPFSIKMMNLLSVKLMARGLKPSAKQHERMIREYLCNRCPEEMVRFALKHPVKTEPPAVASERIFRPDTGGTQKYFIKLAADNTGSIEFQDRMIANLGGAREFVMNSDHMPMLSRPGELAYILNRIASGQG